MAKFVELRWNENKNVITNWGMFKTTTIKFSTSPLRIGPSGRPEFLLTIVKSLHDPVHAEFVVVADVIEIVCND